jgi:putative addiction module component (TIGR02574 family)
MTTDTAEIISIAESLPIERRLEIIDRLLQSVQPTRAEVDRLWILEAERRADEIASGQVRAVPGETVRQKVKDRFRA